MRDIDRIQETVSRRRYAQLLAAGGIAGLAGCPGGTETDTPGGGGDDSGETDTSTATATDETSSDATATESPAETVPPESERMTDRARIFVENTPDEFDWNPHAPQDNSAGNAYMAEIEGFGSVTDSSSWRMNPTFEAPHIYGQDEFQILTWLEDVEVEPPYDVYNYHDDRCTFWNGEPYDAVARNKWHQLDHYAVGNKYQEGQIHRGEAVDKWTYHWWYPKGEVPGSEAQPRNRTVLEGDARGAPYMLPPEWTEPWNQKMEAAGTQEAYQEQISDLRGDRVSLERLAETGWGSSAYELRSTDDVGSDRVLLHLRDEDADHPHPNAEHANLPIIQLQMGSQDRRLTLISNGAVDIGGGAVNPNNQINREMLPDHMKETLRYLRPDGGDGLWWNMNNPHLENLWVRRALATVIDFKIVGNNGWGEQRSIPLEYQTGMLDILSESTFSEEFLDSLHDWPIPADVETATEYMENAGYERQGGTWTSPEGEEFTVDIQIPGIGDWVGAAQTIRQQLREFGINCTFTQHDWSTWTNNLDTFANENAPNFDMSIHWYGMGDPFGHYKSQAAWWDNGSIVGGDPNGEGDDRRSADPDDDYTILNQPLQAPLPTEVGSIEAPTGADAAPNNPPDLEGVTDYEMVNLPEIMNNIQEPADSEEAVQERFRTCARYYNYYLPKFAFHQYTFGEWGNVRDLDWPPEGHESLMWERGFNITDSISIGGVVQPSYDDELDR